MTIELDKLVGMYVKLRDHKAAIEKRQKEELLPIVAGMERIQQELHRALNTANAESIRTTAGTFFKKLKTSVTVANRETYLNWIKETGNWDLADLRAAKTNVLKYKEEHSDIPPGIDYYAEVEVQVRRD